MADNPIKAHRPGTTTQGVTLLTLAQFATVAFGYAVHVLGSRFLLRADPINGKAEYGRFVVVLSTVTWFHVGLGALIVPGICKIVSENHARLREAMRTAVRWHWVATGVCAVGLLATAPLLARTMGDPALAPLLMVGALELPFYAGLTLARYLLIALRHYAAASVALTAYSIVRAAGACLLFYLTATAVGGSIGLAAGSIVGGIIGMSYLLTLRSELPSEPYPPMVRRSLSWAVMTLPAGLGFMTLVTLDMWLVKALIKDPNVAGIYAAAFAVSRLPDILSQGLTTAVFAKVSHALAEGKTEVARSVSVASIRFLLVVFVPICTLTACCSKGIMQMLYTSEYADAAPVLAILVTSIACSGAFKLALSLLSAADRPGPRLVFVVALMPVSLVLNVLLIRHYGMMGAAAASLITMALGTVIGAVFVYRFLRVLPPVRTALRCAAAGAIVYGLGLMWMPPGVLVVAKLALLGVVYVGVLALLGEIGMEDVRSVRHSLLRKKAAAPAEAD